uniref:Exocyst subunit Exo70 family protein n=1 Tax=Ananas comosus var. bracteatus TaxID=296719 RepID=A0A6V7P452_ANACO|nr:unnamed protein product [Ananas comosus var. bracteatus]
MGSTTTTTSEEEEEEEEEEEVAALMASRSAALSVLRSATDESSRLSASGTGLLALRGGPLLPSACSAAASLRSLAISARSLHSRIDRALAPSLPLLRSFALVDSLHRRLLLTSHSPSLLPYLDLVDRLGPAVAATADGCGPAIRRLQEAVEFVTRTKAADRPRRRRLVAAHAALSAIYESELDAMRFEGPLDDALVRLQDRYEALLRRLKHPPPPSPATADDQSDRPDQIEDSDRVQSLLGSEEEVEVLRRISETLAANDCVDVCIDIFIKVRYRRAAKALMRLNPAYLKTYAPEEIDGMEWEALEAAVAKWTRHLEAAVASVLAAERQLCRRALGGIMGGAVWPECFAKISDRIMAVFFRFGEGVARGAKEPQRLFKLLDMLDALDRLRPSFDAVFDAEAGADDIRTRYRELQKLLVHAAARVLSELGLQIEGQSDDAPFLDVAVPKIVRYAINYLKCLAGGGYAALMGRVLRTERAWKAGDTAGSEPDEDSQLLKDVLLNTLEALRRNVEARRGAYSRDDDAAAAHLMAMNAYWYMYMRTKGSELAKLVGEEVIKERYKTAAEEAAWAYQDATWGPLVRILQAKGEEEEEAAEEVGEYPKNTAREKAEAFVRGLDDMIRKHPATEQSIPDGDLREQIKESTTRMVVGAYAAFLHANGGKQEREFLPPDSIRRLVWELFDCRRGGSGSSRGDGSYVKKAAVVAAEEEKRGRNSRRRESKDWRGEAQN